jgi:isoleucyl-tRNA synthetase
MLKDFQERKLYERLMKKNQGKPKFILHDGPPYANGDIHIGTALNKIVKDMIVRYKNMTGFYSPYVPGWDTHGLPIESAIMKNKKIKFGELSTTEFRDKCREYAMSFVDRQREEFKRLGVIGDWEHPYLTLTPDFEAEQIRVFGAMAEKGYIYKGLKPVYWCYTDETALAEAEIEYQDDPCTTLYVKFQVADDKGKLSQFGDLSKMSFVIWTTTAWTLPGNRAISLNPELDYVLMKAENGEMFIVAEGLSKNVAKVAGLGEIEILATEKGSFFELMTAHHPFATFESVILCGDHVTLDAGTGCVHTAPGFGADDFAICQRYDKEGKTQIGTPVPVNSRGVLIDERFSGVHISKSNEAIIPVLEESGALLAKEEIVHAYPHCWRCKHPIIFRATEQWFCSVDSIKEDAVAACDQILWKPDWGKERMAAMIAERSDWCISRQRKWGVPIPIFFCDSCGEHIVTPKTIDHVATLFAEHTSNIWFEKDANDLVPEGFLCPHCGHDKFSKETDIMDVWFDSGSTHAAVLAKRPELSYPADLYLEGGDQYRGWFQSSMLTSIAANKIAPYKQIVTHGWTVDGEGKAMHKSAGNAVSPDEIIKEYGADVLRLWVSSGDFTQDVRISKDIMKQLSQAYLKIRNTARYMLGNLHGFDPNELTPYEKLFDLDRFALHSFNELVKTVRESFEVYDFHAVYRGIYNYCVVDLSNFYFDIIKDRLYCDDKAARAAAQTTLYRILDGLTRILAPILAFTSEEIWASMPHDAKAFPDSVLLNELPTYVADFVLSEADRNRWNTLVSLRDAVNKALENRRSQGGVKKNQDAELCIFAKKEEDAKMLQSMDLATLFIVSKVTVVHGEGEGELAEGSAIPATISVAESQTPKCPRCWNHHDEVNEEGLCPRCAKVVSFL